MKHFYRVAQGIDVNQINLSLKTNNFWGDNPERTNFENSPHREAQDIWLRFADIKKHKNKQAILDDLNVVPYPAFYELYQIRNLLFALMGLVQGERLGRAVIAKLEPGKRIYPHRDEGRCAKYYQRYHAVLQSGPGCVFRCDDEEIQMNTGEIWWVNNKVEHEVMNNSADDRIHLIVDIK